MKSILTRIKAVLQALPLRQCVAVVLVAMSLLTIGASSVRQSDLAPHEKAAVQDNLSPGESGRPRTMGQWEAEAEAVEGRPLKRLERIAKESADAVEDMAEIYPQNARTLTPGVDNGKLPRDD